MKLKSLLIVPVLACAPAMSFAAEYYVTPAGAGDKSGSSWENAFGVEEFRAQAAKNVNGDIYNFAGGKYVPSATIIIKEGTGAILNGSADGERTIFSGDKNGDNKTDNGDLRRLIRFVTKTKKGDTSCKVEVNDIDFTRVYTDATDPETNMGAFVVDNSGCVLVNNCNFYNCWSDKSYGGAPVNLYRSSVTFTNCVFRNNTASNRGGVVRVYTTTSVSNKGKGVTTFDRCLFKENKASGGSAANGGCIYVQDTEEINIINTTFNGNSTTKNGAVIAFADVEKPFGARKLNIVNCTMANNNATGTEAGAQISALPAIPVNVVNSIIVNNDNKTASFAFNGAAEKFVSGGWNYAGEVAEGTTGVEWQTTDHHGADCNYAAIFGENRLNDKGVVVPFKFYEGASVAQVEAAVKEWGIPANVNLAVDQLGLDRSEGQVPGAYSAPGVNTGVDAVEVESAARLVSLGNGTYMIEGSEAPVEVYSIAGVRVATSGNGVVSLENCQPGLYILKSGTATYKVIR